MSAALAAQPLTRPVAAGAALRALAEEPLLLAEAVRTARAHAPRRWWCRPPFLPLPDRAWLAFRLETAYGASDAEMPVEDLLGYLRWCRALRHDRRSPIRRCTPPAR